MQVTMEEITRATGGKLLSEGLRMFSGVSTDTRVIREGEIFFALRGDRFDGHDFIGQALEKAAGAVVDTVPGRLPAGKMVVLVKDTLRALQDLAHYRRMKFDIPVVAVTGSNGKTTTKEMTYAVLSEKFRTHRNEGNLNNHIGLPLSLLKLENDHEAIVLEMGMNASGEIRRLCEIAVPTHGIVTNIGSAHIGRLGSLEAVREAKLEVLQGLHVAVINADDSFLVQGVYGSRGFNGEVITFSVRNDSHVRAKEITATETGSRFRLELRDSCSIPVSLNVHGVFNVYNALAAAAAGLSLGVPPEKIKRGLESFRGYAMRFEIRKFKDITVINDTYNANPSSVEASIAELIRLGAEGRKVAVLGDMRELEDFSESSHRDTGRIAAERGIDVFVAVGQMMSYAAEEFMKVKGGKQKAEIYSYRNAEEAGQNISGILKQGDTVLVKGSRAMQMERVAERIADAL